jgi:integrase
MASIVNNNGLRHIEVFCPDGQRRRLSLGRVNRRNAESVKVYIENIVGAIRTGAQLDHDTAGWLMQVDDKFHKRLVRMGLAETRKTTNAQLAKFCDDFIAAKPVKTNTRENLQQVRRWLVDYFGETRNLRNVTAADAEKWRDFLRTKIGENTLRRHIGRARQFWTHAIRRGLAKSNPFEGMSASVRSDKGRLRFIDRATTQKVIDACPNAEWKLIVALARYGGLRVPSETNRLRWEMIDWDRGRVTVESPKTEHIEGKEQRIIPLFPELRPFLLAAFEDAPAGERYVIRRQRGQNLRTSFLKIVERASVPKWPKPFHNLRASRETELTETLPLHVVCAWIGNSPRVAQEHYLMVHDAFFDIAAGTKAQNPAQQPQAENRDPSQTQPTNRELRLNTAGCGPVRENEYPRQGANYPANSTETQARARRKGALTGAPVARRAESIRKPSIRRATAKIRAALASSLRRPRGAGKGVTSSPVAFGNSGTVSPGEALTLNTSVWRSGASVCSLSRILETGPVPQRYFLTAKACRGILRRAEKRGRELPELLRLALEKAALQTEPKKQTASSSPPTTSASATPPRRSARRISA